MSFEEFGSKVKSLLGGGEKDKQDDKGSSQKGSASRYAAIPANLKKGGKIRKTGYAKVHKGEKVIPKKGGRKRNRRKS